jgi:hypothetical protein
MRTDPSSVQGTVTVEVAIDDSLPPGTRADLAVDSDRIERLPNVLFGRPGFGQAEALSESSRSTKARAKRVASPFNSAVPL